MSRYEDLVELAEERLDSWPIAELRAAGVSLDRVRDNPEAPRYFLAYGDWHKTDADEIFQSFDPAPAAHTQIYVDFPYCPKVCSFCAFYGTVARSEQEMTDYVEAVKVETDLVTKVYFDRGARAEALELGGGTPTHFPLPLLRELVEYLFERLPFSANEEHNFEATPESVLEDEGFAKLRYLRERGFGRMSLGAQSFDEAVLAAINRPHGAREIEAALRQARRLEFDRINFDLVIGLVDQTLRSFVDSVERTIDLGVDIVELYTMRYFDTKKPVPIASRLEQSERFLDERKIQLGRIIADHLLRGAGYRSANGRTYQKDDGEFYADYYRENFRGSNVVGLGRKSHSNVYPWQYANYRNIDKYKTKLGEGRLPIAAGVEFGARAMFGKLLTGALQLFEPIDYEGLRARFPSVDSSELDDLIHRFERLGLLARRDGVLTKTSLGGFFIEEMLKRVFDATVSPFDSESAFLGKPQHSAGPAPAH